MVCKGLKGIVMDHLEWFGPGGEMSIESLASMQRIGIRGGKRKAKPGKGKTRK